jgi:hypothetical protein
MSPTEIFSEPPVLANQTHILENQENLTTNQKVIKQNQADILKNQEKRSFILKNQEVILKNQEVITNNQEKFDSVLKKQETILKNQTRIPILRPARPHGSRRDQDPELHRKFGRDALLAPSRVLPHHAPNQLAKNFRNPRSSQPRLPPPKQLEPLAMPADEGLRLNNHQRRSPVEQLRP